MKDYIAGPPVDKRDARIELSSLTEEVPTTLVIFCTQPFQLIYTHPRDPNQNMTYPYSPLPMGVPVVIRDCDWTNIVVLPRLFPAQLRVWTQANVHVEPPPGVSR